MDMESGAVAEAAAHAGMPFLAIRAISDPVEFSPPPVLLDAVRPDGSADLARLLPLLVRRIFSSRHATSSRDGFARRVFHPVCCGAICRRGNGHEDTQFRISPRGICVRLTSWLSIDFEMSTQRAVVIPRVKFPVDSTVAD